MAVYYIKLGARGAWARECFEHGILRLGYNEISHDEALQQNDEIIRNAFRARLPNGDARKDGAITNHIRQIRTFYRAIPDDLWITLVGDLMHWCNAAEGVIPDENGTRFRHTIAGWSQIDQHGQPLDALRGSIRALSRFQGTICEVRGPKSDYVRRRIEGETVPEFDRARLAYQEMAAALSDIIRTLDWADFETFVDLIFRESGFRRTGSIGGMQEAIDIDLTQPLTGQRLLVQVKSDAGVEQLLGFRDALNDFENYSRAYFVVHTPMGHNWPELQSNRIEVLKAEDLARKAVEHGLTQWLIERAR